MQRLKQASAIFIAIVLLVGPGALIFFAFSTFFNYISSVPQELGAALVAAATTTIVATITVMVGRYFERKKELDALHRDKKTEIYEEFLKVFLEAFGTSDGLDGKTKSEADPDLEKLFREFSRKLVLWGGPQVLEAFAQWKEFMAEGNINAESIFKTERFLDAIRADLGHSNFGVRAGWFARLFMQESKLFLAMAKENPKISLTEVSAAANIPHEFKRKGRP